MAAMVSSGGTCPRIYVASLAAYNAGILHGAWIDATTDADDMRAAVSKMLASCPEHGEEFAIHDYEEFGNVNFNEFDSLCTIAAYMELFEEHQDAAWSAIAYAGDLDEAKSMLSEGYGHYDSREDWAEEHATDCGLIGDDSPIYCYIDWERFARDLEQDYTVIDDEDGTLVFNYR